MSCLHQREPRSRHLWFAQCEPLRLVHCQSHSSFCNRPQRYSPTCFPDGEQNMYPLFCTARHPCRSWQHTAKCIPWQLIVASSAYLVVLCRICSDSPWYLCRMYKIHTRWSSVLCYPDISPSFECAASLVGLRYNSSESSTR